MLKVLIIYDSKTGNTEKMAFMIAEGVREVDDVECVVKKVGAAFTSSGGTATGAETTLLSILKAMLIHGMIVQGNPNDKHYGMAVVEALSKKEEKLCRMFGRRTAELIRRVRQ